MHDGSARPIEILMVEDNPSDVRLTMRREKVWCHDFRLDHVKRGNGVFLRFLNKNQLMRLMIREV